jgi:peptidoglycan/xylan/chitin deacetylase (PgdA/CDA1 family)
MSSGIKTKQHSSYSGILENWKGACISFLSESFHLVSFELRSPVSPFEKGMLIMSVDVDVGSKEIGVINRGKNDHNVSRRMSEYEIGEIEEATIPEFIKLLDAYKMPATFAIRGQLAEVPDWALAILLKPPTKHDIAAHGYYHRRFQSLSYNEAEAEIKMISHGMQKLELTPKSFVFPRNSVSHLKLLEKYGYECYRDYGDFLHDSMCMKKHGNLWDVHPSLLIDKHAKFVFLKKILDVAINRRLPMHLWFHMRDFGKEPSEIKRNVQRVFIPLLDYADRKARDGVLTFETMLSAARKAESIAGL